MWDFTLFPVALVMASDDRGGFFTGDYYLQKGFHRYFFSMSSSRGNWKQSRSYQRGIEPVYPLLPIFADGSEHNASLPEFTGFCKVSPSNIVVTALKCSEDDDSLFIRFYEVEGKDTDVTIELPCAIERATLTDLIEKDKSELEIQKNRVLCKLKPFEIGNIKILPRRKNNSGTYSMNEP